MFSLHTFVSEQIFFAVCFFLFFLNLKKWPSLAHIVKLGKKHQGGVHFMDDFPGKSKYNTGIHFSAVMRHRLKCFTELKEEQGTLFFSKYTSVQDNLLYYKNLSLISSLPLGFQWPNYSNLYNSTFCEMLLESTKENICTKLYLGSVSLEELFV